MSTGTKTQTPVDLEQASKLFTKLVNEKKAKGYTEGEAGTPYLHSEKHPSGVQCQLLNPIDEEEASRLVADDNWCMQEKFDGRRLLVQRHSGNVHGINRKGLVVGIPEAIAMDAARIRTDFIIDGEAVGDLLFAFDLLEVNGCSIRKLPYQERLNQLHDLLEAIDVKHIQLANTAAQSLDKAALLSRLKREKREGVVFKGLDAPYTAGRPNSGGTQLKHKFYATLSAVVTKVNKQRSAEVSLLVGGNWQSAGNVTIPANHQVPTVGTAVEIKYLYAFKESGCLYQPSYLGQREDINPAECIVTQLKFKAGEDGDS